MYNVSQNINELKIEDSEVINQLFKGKTLDIIIELMDNELTEEQLINRLEIYPMKLKYYLSKLETYGIIECMSTDVVKQKIKYMYKLKQDNISMLMNSHEESRVSLESLSNLSKYQEILKRGFKVMAQNPELPNKQGVIFIHTSETNAQEFKKQLNMLIDKFISIEEKDKKTGYMFLPMLFPYELEEKG